MTVDLTNAPVVVRYTWRGPAPTPLQLMTLRKALAGGGHLTADTGLLIDMREMTTSPSFGGLRFATAAVCASGPTPRAAAFVAGNALQYDMARQNEMMLPHTVQGGVFSDEADALKWLGIGDHSPSVDATWAAKDTVIRRRTQANFGYLVFQLTSQDLRTGARKVIGSYVDEASAMVAARKAAAGGTVWFHDAETGALSWHGAGRARK